MESLFEIALILRAGICQIRCKKKKKKKCSHFNSHERQTADTRETQTDRPAGRYSHGDTGEESEAESNLLFSGHCVVTFRNPSLKTPGAAVGVTLVTAQNNPLSPLQVYSWQTHTHTQRPTGVFRQTHAYIFISSSTKNRTLQNTHTPKKIQIRYNIQSLRYNQTK